MLGSHLSAMPLLRSLSSKGKIIRHSAVTFTLSQLNNMQILHLPLSSHVPSSVCAGYNENRMGASRPVGCDMSCTIGHLNWKWSAPMVFISPSAVAIHSCRFLSSKRPLWPFPFLWMDLVVMIPLSLKLNSVNFAYIPWVKIGRCFCLGSVEKESARAEVRGSSAPVHSPRTFWK